MCKFLVHTGNAQKTEELLERNQATTLKYHLQLKKKEVFS